MQKNIQQHEQFITEFGALLAQQTNQRQPLVQRQAVANLADYLAVARRHQKLTRVALAHKTGKSEIEIFALEQGLLPYAEIDLPFLHRLAVVLGEDVETLVLLLGRSTPTVVANPMSSMDHPSVTRPTTHSQRYGNWLFILCHLNPLYKHYLDLIDSWQEGRLFNYPRSGYRMGVIMAVSACLLLLWVSTYSLSNFFEAQSTLQSSTNLPLQAPVEAKATKNVRRQPVAPSPGIAPLRYPEGANIASSSGHWGQMRQATIFPTANEQNTAVTVFTLPASTQSPQCDSRTVGRFALCRV